MSKKYVPSFLREGALREGALRDGALREGALKDGCVKQPLKDGALREGLEPASRNFSQERNNNSNAFSRVSHDNRKEKPALTTPATLASITSLNGEPNSKSTGSFASKFAEQVRISEDPNYQKPVDLSSVSFGFSVGWRLSIGWGLKGGGR